MKPMWLFCTGLGLLLLCVGLGVLNLEGAQNETEFGFLEYSKREPS
jgi:hypothetical protein